jgi:queuine/archaeosine tRNA-ribosyltransferase
VETRKKGIRARIKAYFDGLAYGWIMVRGVEFWRMARNLDGYVRTGNTPIESYAIWLDEHEQIGCDCPVCESERAQKWEN